MTRSRRAAGSPRTAGSRSGTTTSTATKLNPARAPIGPDSPHCWPPLRRAASTGSRQTRFPTHLLAGPMVCGSCGATIAQGSGKNGGYYGCLGATKGACDNKTLVRRTLAERVIIEANDELADLEHVAYVLRRIEEEIAKLRSDLPDALKLKEAELAAEERRLANFVDFVGEGRGSRALAKPLVETERRVESLTGRSAHSGGAERRSFQPSPIAD